MKSTAQFKSIKPGRPAGTGRFKTRLPEVRVTQGNLMEYREAASQSNISFSEWVRHTLDKAVGKSK